MHAAARTRPVDAPQVAPGGSTLAPLPLLQAANTLPDAPASCPADWLQVAPRGATRAISRLRSEQDFQAPRAFPLSEQPNRALLNGSALLVDWLQVAPDGTTRAISRLRSEQDIQALVEALERDVGLIRERVRRLAGAVLLACLPAAAGAGAVQRLRSLVWQRVRRLAGATAARATYSGHLLAVSCL